MEQGSLGLYLGLRTPQLPVTHAEAGTVLTHWTGRYTFDISRTSFGKRRCQRAASCRTAWFSQDACTGVWIRWALGLASEPVDRGLPAVGGAVVHDPEHPVRRLVGLLGHDLGDQVGERHDAGAVLAAADDLRLVHVVSG